MFVFSVLLLVDNPVDNYACFTLLVLIVHTVHNMIVLIVQSRNIYSRKNAFAHRYGLVKLFCLTPPPGGSAIRGNWVGLVPHRAGKEKNGHNSASVGACGIVTKRIFQTVTWGFNFFFALYIKKKKIKNQIMNGGIKSPPIH
jgi:hypothetical protein